MSTNQQELNLIISYIAIHHQQIKAKDAAAISFNS